MQRRQFRAMDSDIVAVIDKESADEDLAEVPAWFEDWEQILSRFRIDSELSRLNASRGTPRRVTETLWQVFMLAREAERLTNGLVNPFVLKALIQAGYDKSFEELRADAEAPEGTQTKAAPLQRGALPHLNSVTADATMRTLCLPDGVGLDLGGVAKGWAAYTAADRLGQSAPALVSAGGDVAVSGPRATGEAWPIGVEDPFGGADYLEVIHLQDGGVATSGKDRRHWRLGNILQHHLIDPRTGLPAVTDVLTATVIAATVTQAEAMAKAVMISGSDAGLAWLNETEAFAGMLVLDDGRKLYSARFQEYL